MEKNDNSNNIEKYPWILPVCHWKYYGTILKEASCYIEYELNCIIRGLINPDLNETQDEKPDCSEYEREPYEKFIYSTACSFNGKGFLNKKAKKFRNELIEIEIKKGIRNKEDYKLIR